MWIKRFRPSPALVVASLALAVALGGTGYAALSLPPNSVGTAQLKNGAVVAAKVKRGSLRRTNFAPGQLPRGPKGDKGADGLPGAAGAKGDKGDRGEKGDAATKLFAVVDASGNATVKSSGVSSSKTGPNTYAVTFPQSVSNCAPVVSVGFTGGSNGGEATASVPAAGANVVNVATFNEAGSEDDKAFSLAVFC
jgi:hypothetical protein